MRASRGLSFTSAIAVGLGAVALLGACTPDETEPTPSASPTVEEPTPTPTPTTSPEAIAPERPALVDEISVAGAEAVATYFVQLYPYTYATGDLTEWRALSDADCVFCASVVSNVEEQVAAGHTNQGSAISIIETIAWEITPERFGATVRATESPSAEFDSAGNIVSERTESETHLLTFALLADSGGWRVLEIDVEPAEAA